VAASVATALGVYMAKEPYRYSVVPISADFEGLACNTEKKLMWNCRNHDIT